MQKVFLIGNLTKDPELMETPNGTAVCKFSVAVRRNYKGADGQYGTDFFNCVAWKGLGENVAKYCKKGSKVAVVGAFENRTYEKNGEKRTITEMLASEVEFLSNSAGTSNSAGKGKIVETDDYDDDMPF